MERENTAALAQRGRAIDFADVRWWALGLLDLKPGTEDFKVRRARMTSRTGAVGMWADEQWALWWDLVRRSDELASRRGKLDWIEQCNHEIDPADLLDSGGPTTQAVRESVLMSIRSLAQWFNITDDDGNQIVFEDFHVRTVRAMREERHMIALLPFEHGKSFLSSLLVPLADWAEWHDCTQARIYHDESHVKKWTNRLKQQVENNTAIHRIFPWIARPVKGDECYGLWTTNKGFAIRGHKIRDNSFEPLTIGSGRTGLRFHRIGVDDCVVSDDADSIEVQDKRYEYLKTGVLTTAQRTTRTSHYETQFPSVYQVGTLFDVQDVNSRVWEEFGKRDWPRLRFDIYPKGRTHAMNTGETLWQRVVGLKRCLELEIELGASAFEKRCRNRVRAGGHVTFPEEHLDAAIREEWRWGIVPDGCRVLIGFDPGSGRITKHTKAPALVVYGERPVIDRPPPDPMDPMRDDSEDLLRQWRSNPNPDMYVHIIETHRLAGYSFPRQCEMIAAKAEQFQCKVVVEENHIQSAYREEINRRFPSVKVETHITGDNKRDPRDGVETFQPLFENHRIFIHAGDAPADAVEQFRQEFKEWPNPRYSDQLMAAWVARYNAKLIREHEETVTVVRPASVQRVRFSGRRYVRVVSL